MSSPSSSGRGRKRSVLQMDAPTAGASEGPDNHGPFFQDVDPRPPERFQTTTPTALADRITHAADEEHDEGQNNIDRPTRSTGAAAGRASDGSFTIEIDGRTYTVLGRTQPPQLYFDVEEDDDFSWGLRVPAVPERVEEFLAAARRRLPRFTRPAVPARRRHEHHGETNNVVRRFKRARVPASSKTIQGLQVVTLGDDKLRQAECAVCLQDFHPDDDKLRAMPCSAPTPSMSTASSTGSGSATSVLSAATRCPRSSRARRRKSTNRRACRCHRRPRPGATGILQSQYQSPVQSLVQGYTSETPLLYLLHASAMFRH
ncbi:hypothetical protein EJB05_29529, partial [Eragrostis curvula]